MQSSKVVCVDKGEWNKGKSLQEMMDFNMEWLGLCRDKLKDNGTIWISGTYHNIFSVANCLNELGYKILNVVTWAIHRQIFRVDTLPIAPNLLFGQGKETSLFQLRFDEVDKWRQADDRCVAFACHCPLGKIVWQTPYSKAVGVAKSHNNGIY